MRFLRQKTSFLIAENIVFHVRKQHFPKLELLFSALENGISAENY